MMLNVIVTVSLVNAYCCYGQTTDFYEVEKLVRQWAPLVWMSPKEKYLPLGVEDFLSHVYVANENGKPEDGRGKTEKKLYLFTRRPLDKLKNETSSFLYGKNPNHYPVPIYAVVTQCGGGSSSSRLNKHKDINIKKGSMDNDIKTVYDNNNNNEKKNMQPSNRFYFHVSYWIFYPYNEGKDICFLGRVPTPRLFNTCLGKFKTMGSHVGDWEHMSLTFNGRNVPDKMFLAVHDIGAYYKYQENGHYFKFESATNQKRGQASKFPQIVRTQGQHPVVFAAQGSHGLWASPGEHDYVRVPRLSDRNGYGIPWKTWTRINIFHIGYSTLPSWMNFRGKWGNPKRHCLLFKKLGICEYVDGPPGILLRDKQDFHCWPN